LFYACVLPATAARRVTRKRYGSNARKGDGIDAPATALATSRNERLAAVDPEAASEVLRLHSERRGDLVAESSAA
jgi:hypothetical protein